MTSPAAITDLSEAALIALAQAGDRHAFGLLAADHSVRLFTFLARRRGCTGRIGGRAADTEDLCQISLLRAWLTIETYRPDRAAFSTWLLTIANRVAITEFRRERPHVPTSSIPEEITDGRAPSPAAALAHHESRTNLWDLVDRVLTPDVATVVWLRYAESLEVADIANVLSWPTVRVRVTLHRARAQLLAALRAEPNSAPDSAPPFPTGAAHAPAL